MPFDQGIIRWRPLVEKAGYKMDDIPKTGMPLRFSRTCRRNCADQRVQRLWLCLDTTNGNDPNSVHYFTAYGGWTSSPRTANCTPTPEGKGGIKTLIYPTTAWEIFIRRARSTGTTPTTTTPSCQNDRHGPRRYALDRSRGAVTGQEGDTISPMGLALSNDGAGASPATTALIPKGQRTSRSPRILQIYPAEGQ